MEEESVCLGRGCGWGAVCHFTMRKNTSDVRIWFFDKSNIFPVSCFVLQVNKLMGIKDVDVEIEMCGPLLHHEHNSFFRFILQGILNTKERLFKMGVKGVKDDLCSLYKEEIESNTSFNGARKKLSRTHLLMVQGLQHPLVFLLWLIEYLLLSSQRSVGLEPRFESLIKKKLYLCVLHHSLVYLGHPQQGNISKVSPKLGAGKQKTFMSSWVLGKRKVFKILIATEPND